GAGLLRSRAQITRTTKTDATQVGNPKSVPSAEVISSTTATNPIPPSASFPAGERCPSAILLSVLPRRVPRQYQNRATKVARIESTDANAKVCSHCASGGTPE